jgi:hypothetical protein
MKLARIASVGMLVAMTGFSEAGPVTASTAAGTTLTVTLRLIIGDTPVRLSVPNGEMARLGIRDQQVVGLIPSVGSDRTILTIVEIRIDPVTAEQRFQELGQIALIPGVVSHFSGAVMPLEVELIGTTPSTGVKGSFTPVPNGPCMACCVPCNGFLFCACSVETECGSCCCPASSMSATCGSNSPSPHPAKKKRP